MLNQRNFGIDLPHVIRVGETALDKMQNIPLMTSYVTVCICKSGMATFNINFRTFVVRKNSIMVLYDDSFAVLQKKSRSFCLDYILIDKRFATDVAFQLPNHLFAFFNELPVLNLSMIQANSLEHWLHLLRQLLEMQGEYYLIQLRNHLQNFFLEIANQVNNIVVDKKIDDSRKTKLCWQFWQLITQHCRKKREVQFYADELAITPFYLSQITKSFFNESPKALIDRQVILEIKALLDIHQLSIKQIADELNFDDTSYLCRYFKRHTGKTFAQFKQLRHQEIYASQK